MIGRRYSRKVQAEQPEPKGFDDFELRLGDMMRGERATMGKSLLDVQRELRIRASYIAAIENADPTVFDTPGFIAGYVRSYARYLGMDPDRAFAAFCAESGFETAHGMSSRASSLRKPDPEPAPRSAARDPFSTTGTPFVPVGESILSRIEPGAVGSVVVLLGLIAGIGFGGFSVLREIQRVQLTPVDQTPVVLSDLDPLEAAARQAPAGFADPDGPQAIDPVNDALERLYRPQALDVPVLVARDAPISTLDPSQVGSFADRTRPDLGEVVTAAADQPGPDLPAIPRVVEDHAPQVALFAVRPAWVRVRAADGSVIFEKILDAGEEYVLPATQEPPTLRAGMSGSLYFQVNGELYGPAGPGTSTAKDVALSVDLLKERYQVADLSADPEAAKIVALAEAMTVETTVTD